MLCRLCVLAAILPALQLSCRPGEQPSSLTVTIQGDVLVPQGESATLTATAVRGARPYLYRWNQERGPVNFDLTDETGATLVIAQMDEQGEYVFRVVAMDARGDDAVAFVTVVVGPSDIDVGEFNLLIQGPEEIAFGETVTFTSFTDREDATFQWEVVEGGMDLTSADEADTDAVAVALGTILLRLTAVDTATDETKTAEHTIEVGANVEVDALHLSVIGEPLELSAAIEPDSDEVTYLWEVLSGTATFDDNTAANPTIITDLPETLSVQVTVTSPSSADSPPSTTLELEVVSVPDLAPRVLVATTAGNFTLELEGELAPLTTANLLAYVDDGFFDGVLVHRLARSGVGDPFVIQMGGYIRPEDGGDPELEELTRDPVLSEADNGLSNGTIYSVAMALSGGNADSGTTQFFINLHEDNVSLDEQDFTVFAHVVEGTDIIDAMIELEVIESPILRGEESFPAEDIVIISVTRVADGGDETPPESEPDPDEPEPDGESEPLGQ